MPGLAGGDALSGGGGESGGVWAETKLSGDELPEGDFGGSEHGD